MIKEQEAGMAKAEAAMSTVDTVVFSSGRLPHDEPNKAELIT